MAASAACQMCSSPAEAGGRCAECERAHFEPIPVEIPREMLGSFSIAAWLVVGAIAREIGDIIQSYGSGDRAVVHLRPLSEAVALAQRARRLEAESDADVVELSAPWSTLSSVAEAAVDRHMGIIAGEASVAGRDGDLETIQTALAAVHFFGHLGSVMEQAPDPREDANAKVGCGMSVTTAVVPEYVIGDCSGCVTAAVPIREGSDGDCVACERAMLTADEYVIDIARSMLRPLIDERRVHSDDLVALVGEMARGEDGEAQEPHALRWTEIGDLKMQIEAIVHDHFGRRS